MDFEMDGTKAGITIILWLLLLVVIWKFNIGIITMETPFPFGVKLMFSVVMLPLTYIIICWQTGD